MQNLQTRFAALMLLTASTVAAHAAELGPSPSATQGWAPPALPPCTCRAQGRDFDTGEETCLATADGPRLAICAMDQNVTSWKPTARTCPNASRKTGQKLG